MSRMFNSRVKSRVFNIGDLVRKRSNVMGDSAGYGKLGENLKGAFKVLKVIHLGSCKLVKLDGWVIKIKFY